MSGKQTRRSYLRVVGALGTLGIGGCLGGESANPTATSTATTTSTTTVETTTTTTEETTTTTEQETTTTVEPPPDYDPEKIREEAEYIAYDELFRNIEYYEGEAIHFPGAEVDQAFHGAVDEYRIYVGRTPEDGSNDVYAQYDGRGRLIEGDQIELWGVVEGTITYETVLGEERTIPLITLVDFEMYDPKQTFEKSFGEYYRTPEDIVVTVYRVDLKEAFDSEDSYGDPIEVIPDEGNQWCFVYVDAKNESDSSAWLPSAYDINVISGNSQYDSQTLYYDPTDLSEDRYEGGEVEGGISRMGWVAYQIPEDLSVDDLKVVWSDDVPGLEWTVEWTKE